jgi:hypothetical protein
MSEGLKEEWGRQNTSAVPCHRIDELPVGYSWQVALQHCPLPLHQLGLILTQQSAHGKTFVRTVMMPP